MSVAAGGEGGQKGQDDPSKKKKPDSKSGGNKDDERKWNSGQKECPECHLFVYDLKAHQVECIGKRDFKGDFACTMPGCTVRYPFYAQLTRHFNTIHAGEQMPEVMRNYTRYFSLLFQMKCDIAY